MDSLFVAVHVGAGYHAKSKSSRYRQVCALACHDAMEALRKGCTALEAVEKAIVVLETDPLMNAGTGSNLTLDGTVECDASCMDGNGGFAGVGAISGIVHPISVATLLLTEERKGLLSLGRIPPIFLCGSGARKWASDHGLETFDPEESDPLCTESSRSTYDKYMGLLRSVKRPVEENGLENVDRKRLRAKETVENETEDVEVDDHLHDTVGAVCFDIHGNLASGVSSGGIALKYPGRVGEAAIFAAGCWSLNPTSQRFGAACSTTGTGEQIMKTCLARTVVEGVCEMRKYEGKKKGSDNGSEKEGNTGDEEDGEGDESDLERILREEFLESPLLSMYEDKAAGLILLRVSEKFESASPPRGEFWFAHTTPSMGIGYMRGNDSIAKTILSRLPEGKDLKVSGISL